MRPGLARARWTRRGGAGAQTGSLRILPLLVCALAVIAGYRRLRSNDLQIAGTAGLTAERVTLTLSGPISS